MLLQPLLMLLLQPLLMLLLQPFLMLLLQPLLMLMLQPLLLNCCIAAQLQLHQNKTEVSCWNISVM